MWTALLLSIMAKLDESPIAKIRVVDKPNNFYIFPTIIDGPNDLVGEMNHFVNVFLVLPGNSYL